MTEFFGTLWQKISDDTIMGPIKTKTIYDEISSIVNLDGCSAEIGVYKGYTSKFIHMMMPNKTHYCYDTFCGIIEANPTIDVVKNGEFAYSLEYVKKNIDMPNVIYKDGYFPATFGEYDEKFCFVHSDTDTYVGTQNTIKYFSDRIVVGGKILFDDYEWSECPGVKKAIEEFIQHDTQFLHIPLKSTTQYLLIKK